MTSIFPRMTREPSWFQSESCCEISVFCLIDAGFDLKRAVDELVLGKLVHDKLAVVQRIAAGR
jgi:hypothetical protein